MNFIEKFDLITLIYYDFGVLSTEERDILLKKIYTALRPDGLLIFDVLTPQYFANKKKKKFGSMQTKTFSAKNHTYALNLFIDMRSKIQY